MKVKRINDTRAFLRLGFLFQNNFFRITKRITFVNMKTQKKINLELQEIKKVRTYRMSDTDFNACVLKAKKMHPGKSMAVLGRIIIKNYFGIK